MARVRKNDTVVILSGKDKGKKGAVLHVQPDKNRVMIKDACIQIKHVKARKQGESSGIKKEESWIHLSKVMPICSACKKACRINSKLLETGKRVRICNGCKEIV